MPAHRPWILVVDDDVELRTIVEDVLVQAGYRVTTAGDGREALDLLADARDVPDAIVLDEQMPVLDAAGFLSGRRCTGELAHVPVLLMTGMRGRSAAAEAWIGDVHEVLRKPPDVEQLYKAVARCVAASSRRLGPRAGDEAPSATGPDVLVVDDDPDIRSSLVAALREHGYGRVAEANDGLAALAYLRRHPGVRVVLLDLMMPGMDGWSVLRTFGARRAASSPVFVAMSAGPIEGLRAAERLGALASLCKPVKCEVLLEAVRSAEQDAHV
jgi:CheY-like chemotaxis protein